LPASFSEVIPRHRTIMAVEGAQFHAVRLHRHPEDYGPKISALLHEGLATSAPENAAAREHQRQLTTETQSCFQSVDPLVCPATTGPASGASTTGDPAFNSSWSYTGLPCVSFLAGWTPEGLPLCVQLIGTWWHERELLQIAAWCEAALTVERRIPESPA